MFRVPLRDKYKKGVLFTASGDVVAYEGGAGQPRFTQTTGRFLDFLFLPGLVFFFAAYFVYYGPRPNGRSHPDLPEYKATLIKAARTKFKRSRTLGELERGVTRASNAQDVVLAYEHWQYFGGVRDEDGHPEASPEYSP